MRLRVEASLNVTCWPRGTPLRHPQSIRLYANVRNYELSLAAAT